MQKDGVNLGSRWVSFRCRQGGVGDGRKGVREKERFLEQWRMDATDLRRRMIMAPTPRERWYAILLLAQGLTAAATAEALARDPHYRTLGVGLR